MHVLDDPPESAADLNWHAVRRHVTTAVSRGLEADPPLDTRLCLRRVCVVGSLGAGEGHSDSDVDIVVELHKPGRVDFPYGFDHILSPETTFLSRAYDTVPREMEKWPWRTPHIEVDAASVPSAETLDTLGASDDYPDFEEHVRSRLEYGDYDRLYDAVEGEHRPGDEYLAETPGDGWGEIDVTGFPDD